MEKDSIKEENMKDWVIRALKTFVQATLAYFVANIALISQHVVDWDFANWKGWALPLITGAISAGISAVWNVILEQIDKKKTEQMVNDIMKDIEEK